MLELRYFMEHHNEVRGVETVLVEDGTKMKIGFLYFNKQYQRNARKYVYLTVEQYDRLVNWSLSSKGRAYYKAKYNDSNYSGSFLEVLYSEDYRTILFNKKDDQLHNLKTEIKNFFIQMA